MAYCINCGHELADGAKFCFECGTKVSSQEEQRKTVYDGEIHKCPNCGEILKAFESICPACGTELRGTKSSSAISALAEKIENAHSEEQRILIIQNFPIPNTKGDIFEFMLLAASNFDASFCAMHVNTNNIANAWLIKIEQCYAKAKLSFGDHSDFKRIESIYHEIKREETHQKDSQERNENAKLFGRSKLRIALIVLAVISALCIAVAFNDGRILAGIIAIAMFVLFLVSYLMGSNVIKEKQKNIKLIPMILAVILFIPYFATFSPIGSPTIPGIHKTETIEWSSLAMGNKLPAFVKNEAEVVWDNDNVLILYFYESNKTEFENYINSCKEFGYNIDVADDGANFTAYNSEGYFLHLQYLDWADNQLTIDLERPKNTDPITWPNSELVKNVPIPNRMFGEVSSEYDTSYAVYLVGVEQSYFAEYVSLCMQYGFNIDYSKTKTYFHAKNQDGISITVEYKGFNTLYIWVTK